MVFTCSATWAAVTSPGRPPQVWRRVEDPAKVKADAQRDKDTAALGLELTDDEIARRYGDAWQRRRSGASASGVEFAEAGTEGHAPAERPRVRDAGHGIS